MSTTRDVTASIAGGDVVARRRRPVHRRRRLLALAALVAALIAAAVVVALSLGGGEPAAPAPASAVAARLPAPPAPSVEVGAPEGLSRTVRGTAIWAPVVRAAVARRAPSARAAAVARVGARTPEGTDTIVEVIGRRTDGHGALWSRVRLAGATGWVRRSALGALHAARAHLVVDRGRRTATLVRDGRVLLHAPVAVGRPGAPTPAGRFLVRSRLTGFDAPAYGPVAFGTTARAGGRTVGIAGTDRPQEIGRAASDGGVRLRDADLRRLTRLMAVGTPVTIR